MARATLIHYEEGQKVVHLCEKHGKTRAGKSEKSKRSWWDRTYPFGGQEKCEDCEKEAKP